MASHTLVSGHPRCLPPLPPGTAPTCVPCVEGWQRAAPHSFEFPPTEAPLQTLHMDVWGPARVRGQGHERYFLLVVDDYSRYTIVFPLRNKGEVTKSIHQTFTLPASPQQNGIAEHRIGMVMDVARTSMIHAAAPHFLWPFAVQYAAHQINLQPHVSLPETTPTLRWTGKVGDASVFRVRGSRAIFRDASTDKLSSRAVPCVFLGFPPDAPGWQFFHPTSRRVLSSQDVTFDESVSYYRTASLPPPPLFLALGAPPVDPLPPQGPAPSRVSQVDPVEPVKVAVNSGAARGAEHAGAGTGGAELGVTVSERAEPGGAEPERVEPGGAEPERVEPGGAEPERVEPGGAESGSAEPERAESGGRPGVLSRREPLSPQQLREWLEHNILTWYAQRCRRGAGAGATGGASGAVGGAAGVGDAGGASGAGAARGAAGAGAARAAGPGGAGAGGTGAVGGPAGVGAAGAGGAAGVGVAGAGTIATGGASGAGAVAGTGAAAGAVVGDPGAEGTSAVSALSGGAARPRPYYVPLLQQSTTASSLVAELVDFAAACRLDYATSLVVESAFVSVCPPSVGGECALGTDVLEDRQEEFECFAAAVPHLVSMLLAPEGDPDAPDIPSPRSYAEAIEGPYSSQWQSAMDAEMASLKSTCTYVVEVPPPKANIVSGMWIFRVKRPPGSPPVFKTRYVARDFSQRQRVDFFHTFSPTPKMTTLRVLLHVAAQCDYELHSLDFSTAFLQGSLHEEIWLHHPPGFTGSFSSGSQWCLWRPVNGLRQAPREWHNTLRTTLAALSFAPSTADPSLFLRTDTTLPPFYVLVYVDDLVFFTANTEALAHVKSELQKRRTCTDLGELTSYLGLRITRDRAQRTITLTQSHMVQQVLQRFGFTYSSPQSTPLTTGHSLSAPPSDESVEPSGPYPELVGCLMYLMTCTRPNLAYPLSLLACYVAPGRHQKVHCDAAKRVLRYLCCTSGTGHVLGGWAQVVLTGHADASWVDDLATQRSSQGYTFSLGSGSISWRSTRSSSVLSSSCEAEIYARAMAAQELRWLTYLLTELGEELRSPPFLYVDNKAMLALFQEHRLEHRTKHIAMRYFLSRELQQRGQLRLACVVSQANTADVFTKALQPCDHQRFCTFLGLVPTVPHLLTS
ncbi:unnamed protein product [Closterium sp. NIES-54]